MASFPTDVGAAALADGSIVWTAADIRVRFVDETETGLDASLTSMTGVGVAGTDVALTGRTGPTFVPADERLVYDAADVVGPPVAAGPLLDRAVVYAFVTDDSDHVPLAVIDCEPVTPDGRPVRITWGAAGVLRRVLVAPPDPGSGFEPETYSRASTLTDDLTDVLPDMVPRASDGTPNSGGRMYVVGIGMSNARDYHGYYTNLFNSGDYLSLKAAGFRFYRASQSGHVASDWANPAENAWSQAVTGIITNGGTAAQVLHVDAFMTQSFPDTDGVMTATQCQAIVANAKATFPNLVSLDWHSIAYTGWSSDGRAPLYSVHSDDALLATQVGLIHGVLCDYVQCYAEGETYNAQHTTAAYPSGIRWLEATDYEADFVHPSAAGAEKMARWVLSRWYEDPVKAWMWA